MAGAKLIVLYPRRTDIESFECVYQNQHVGGVLRQNEPHRMECAIIV